MLLKENNPWLGLESYSINDAYRFYGRDNDIEIVSNAICDNFITTIYGISGTGKTSLINAGLRPVLIENNYLPIRIRLNHSSDKSYSMQVIDAITAAVDSVNGEVEYEGTISLEQICENEKLWFFLHTSGFWTKDNYSIRPVIFIDQFEELFTNNDDTYKISSFFEMINAIQYDTPPVQTKEFLENCSEYFELKSNSSRLVFIIREDFIARLEDYSYGIAVLRRNRIGIKQMNGHQALEVILKPNPDLITREGALKILSKVSGKEVIDSDRSLSRLSIDTSILSLFCSELYQRAVEENSDIITSKIIEEFGSNIIAHFYSKSMALVPPTLVTYLEKHLLTSNGYRNSIALEDVEIPKITKEALTSNLSYLTEKRIIRIEETNGVARVEFTHDVLCKIAKNNRDNRVKRKDKWKDNVNVSIYILESIIFLFMAIMGVRRFKIQFLPCMIGLFLILCINKIIHIRSNNKRVNIFIQLSIVLLLLAGSFILTKISLLSEYNYYSLVKFVNIEKYDLLYVLVLGLIIYNMFIKSCEQKKLIVENLIMIILMGILCLNNSLIRMFVLPLFFLIKILPYRLTMDRYYYLIYVVFLLLLFPNDLLFFMLAIGAIFFMVTVFYYKKKAKNINEAWKNCVTNNLYSNFKFLKYFVYILSIIFIFDFAYITGVLLDNVNTLIAVPLVGILSIFVFSYTFVDKNSTTSNHNKSFNVGFITIDKSMIVSYIVGLFILLGIALSQYFELHLLWMCILWILALFLMLKYNKYIVVKSNIIIGRILIILCWGISFVVLPILCMGYNVFTLPQYARAFEAPIRISSPTLRISLNTTGLVKIRNGNNIGLRDRNALVIPVEYHNIMLSTDSEYYQYPEIKFKVIDKNGKDIYWDCFDHLDMDNICSDILKERLIHHYDYTYFPKSDFIRITESFSNKHLDSNTMNKLIFLYVKSVLNSNQIDFVINDNKISVFPTNIGKNALDNLYKAMNSLYIVFPYDKHYYNSVGRTIIARIYTYGESKGTQLHYDISQIGKWRIYAQGYEAAIKDIKQYIDLYPSKFNYAHALYIEALLLSKQYDYAISYLEKYGDNECYMYECASTIYEHNGIKSKYNFLDTMTGSDPFNNRVIMKDIILHDINLYKKYGLLNDTLSKGYVDFMCNLDNDKIPIYNDATRYVSSDGAFTYYLCRLRDERGELKYKFIMHDRKVVSPLFKRYAGDIYSKSMMVISEDDYKRYFISFVNGYPQLLAKSYEHAWRFSEDVAAVCEDNKIGFIDLEGNTIIDFNFPKPNILGNPPYNILSTKMEFVDFIFKNGLCPMIGNNGKYGLIDKEGNWVVDPQYEYMGSLEGNYRKVKSKNKYGVIDMYGNTILPIIYDKQDLLPMGFKYTDGI